MKNSTILLVLLLLFSTALTAQSIRKGPYLIYEDINTEMKVMWQNDATSVDNIIWGTTTSYSEGSANSSEYGTDHQHAYIITGLTPGTKYYYQVEIDGVTHDGSFTAAPEATASSVKFLAYGDTRTYPNKHNLVAEKINAAYASDPDYQTVLISMGDLIGDGNSESSWSNEFFETGLPHINTMLTNIPYQVARGNHEGNGVLLGKYFPYNYQSSRYYSFEYGPALFMVLDQYVSYVPGSAQYIWLENELANTTKPWKIIYFHEPGWTGDGGNRGVRDNIQPLCEQYGVRITFGGHSHFYTRADVTLNNTTVRHITTGGGGAPLYSPDLTRPYIVTGSKSYHFCKIDIVDENIMNVKAVDIYDNIIDQFTIDQSNLTPPTVNITEPLNNTYYESLQPITISADASDPNGVAQVEFFIDGSSVGVDDTAPYSVSWTPENSGSYTITAEATDNLGASAISEPVNISAGEFTELVSVQISSGSDDVEENPNGTMYLNSSDIEIAYDTQNGGNQTVGLRFPDLNIPQGATINSAYVQFTADETSGGATNINIFGHDSDDSPVFTTTSYDVTTRGKTTASVNWSPPDWNTVGEAGVNQQTPDLSAIIQEIVNRPGFSPSSAVSLFISGNETTKRVAEAYEGVANSAAVLNIEYSTQSGNNIPSAAFNYTTNCLEISLTDESTDSNGSIVSWLWDFGDGNTSTLQNPVHTYETAGDYNVTLTVTDNDGLTNSTSQTISTTPLTTYYLDNDGDSYGTPTVSQESCTQPVGYVTNNSDCNDNDDTIHPDATETCDEIDNNCDGQIDEGLATTYYADADFDGFGNPDITKDSCSTPAGYVENDLDCDDTDSAINPDASEECDGVDNNCDLQIDEGLTQNTYYADTDNDGFGDAGNSIEACSMPEGYVENSSDCDDENNTVYPDAPEICDELDNDCDGSTDEGVQSTFYADADNDGFGDAGNTILACSAPTGYVADNNDCNDNDATVYPGATELIDGQLNNCGGAMLATEIDNDGDGYIKGPINEGGWDGPAILGDNDCNDDNAAVNPGVIEICDDGVDNNCNGQTDEGCNLEYCDSHGDATDEWISSVNIDGQVNSSGSSGTTGYEDYTGVIFDLTPGATVSVSLTPGFSIKARFEYWAIWIDYNQNGRFDNNGEQVFTSRKSKRDVKGNFIVPTEVLGTTRMRITMSTSSALDPCGSYTYGEVEDYIVNIAGTGSNAVTMKSSNAETVMLLASENIEPEIEYSLKVYPNPFSNEINIAINGSDNYEKAVVHILDITGKIMFDKEYRKQSKIVIRDAPLTPGVYFIRIQLGEFVQTKQLIKTH